MSKKYQRKLTKLVTQINKHPNADAIKEKLKIAIIIEFIENLLPPEYFFGIPPEDVLEERKNGGYSVYFNSLLTGKYVSNWFTDDMLDKNVTVDNFYSEVPDSVNISIWAINLMWLSISLEDSHRNSYEEYVQFEQEADLVDRDEYSKDVIIASTYEIKLTLRKLFDSGKIKYDDASELYKKIWIVNRYFGLPSIPKAPDPPTIEFSNE